MTDAEKLRRLAEWHDKHDDARLFYGAREFQNDLRRIANLLDAVPPETLEAIKAGEPTDKMIGAAGVQLFKCDLSGCEPRETARLVLKAALLSAAPAKPEE